MDSKEWTLTAALGTLGGAWLILSAMLVGNGKEILLPWALLVVGTIVAVKLDRARGYAACLRIAFGVFLISTLVFYVSIALATGSPGLLGHVARIGFILALSLALALPSARLAETS